jgi:cytochrome b6-f complex iron-sulfur subunit
MIWRWKDLPAEKLVYITNKKDLSVGEAKIFRCPTGKTSGETRPGILIHLKEDQFVAYDGLCTHMQAELTWDRYLQKIVCTYHDGMYHPEHGGPYRGIPKEALPAIKLKIEKNGDIYALV